MMLSTTMPLTFSHSHPPKLSPSHQLRIGRLSPNPEDACNTQLFFDSTVPTMTVTSKLHLSVSFCP